MSIDEYVDTIAPAPEWLKNSWRISKETGNDKLAMRQIDAIIADDRAEILRALKLRDT